MARRKRKTAIAEHPAHDDEALIARLQDEHPEVLEAEVDFDSHMTRILKAGAVEEIPHFYCRPCGQYHEKTHPHHAEMKQRKKQRQRKAKATG